MSERGRLYTIRLRPRHNRHVYAPHPGLPAQPSQRLLNRKAVSVQSFHWVFSRVDGIYRPAEVRILNTQHTAQRNLLPDDVVRGQTLKSQS